MSEKDQRAIEIAEMNFVMSHSSGRNVMRRILNITGVDECTFDPDPCKHAKNAGRREIGIEIRSKIKAAGIDNYLKMIKEVHDG